MIGWVLIHSRLRIDYRIRLSLIYRSLTGILGGFAYIFYLWGESHLLLGIILFVLWGLCLKYGGFIRPFIKKTISGEKSIKKNSWTYSFASGFILVALTNLIYDLSIDSFFVYAITITYAYMGAKAFCSTVGCCGARNKLGKFVLFSNVTLQKLEFFVSMITLIFGITAYFFRLIPTDIVIFFTLFIHGLTRWFAATRRFPNRPIFSFINDGSVSSIFAISIYPLVMG